VPIITKLAKVSGADTLFTGFGNAKHRAHAPNEYFEKKLFRLGYMFAAEMVKKAD
jgi:acetylornithine deacetylase/succinyl-diaminopimelate desuccinylase-like protein